MSPESEKRDARTQNKQSSTLDDHIASIDKLLRAASDLMKQEPTIDKAVVEQLRQVRVRVRYVASVAQSQSPDAVPRDAPALWKDRPKEEDPILFTKRTYSRWLGKSICRSDIKRLDKQLYDAIYNLENAGAKLDEIGLFTKQQLNDRKLDQAGKLKRPSRTRKMHELAPDDREHARLFNLARRRIQRSHKR